MASISTKQTVTSISPSLTENKNTTTYDIGNPGPDSGQAQQCDGVNIYYINSILYSITDMTISIYRWNHLCCLIFYFV
jgi:hypothetical protein